jgi:nucleoid DNA-binding protein
MKNKTAAAKTVKATKPAAAAKKTAAVAIPTTAARALETLARPNLVELFKRELMPGSLGSDEERRLPDFVDGLVDLLENYLSNKQPIRLMGVGCLCLLDKKARTGARNPKTGEDAVVSARTVVTLRKHRIAGSETQEIGINTIVESLVESFPMYSKITVKHLFKTFLNLISGISGGEYRIELRTLGTFYPSYIAPRLTRDPRNGDRIQKPASFAIRFRQSTVLARKINPETFIRQ